MLALFTFRACGVCFMQRPPYFRFGKIVIFSKDRIDSEYRVFFKTLPRSVKTSFMTKGHGQGVLKRKNY